MCSVFESIKQGLTEAVEYHRGNLPDVRVDNITIACHKSRIEQDDMNKDLNYYMELNYRVEVIEDKEEGGFVLHCPELRGCMTCAETLQDGFAMLEDAKKSWFAACLEDGLLIPEPNDCMGEAVCTDDVLREYRWRKYVDECLAVAEAEFQAGVPTIPADDIIAKARKRIADYERENV